MRNIDKPKCLADACENRVHPERIFCEDCFRLVTPEARKNWTLAFPYPVPYDLTMKPGHADQAQAVKRMRANVAFAKRQISLFAEPREEKEQEK